MGRPFEAVFVEQCAPTLAGVKPSNLFSFPSPDGGAVPEALSARDRELRAYGLGVRLLKRRRETGSFLIFTFRAAWMDRILSDPDNRNFLERSGYTQADDFGSVLRQLCERFRLDQFPHEIGILLGYPLRDVAGFMENRGRNFTHCGYWKSYGDPAAAQTCGERYRKCFAVYRRRFESGTPISRLIVAV